MRMIAAALENHDTDWHGDAVATIVALSQQLPTMTSDDLRREMRPAPHANHYGAAFTAARTAGYIEAHGYTTSNAPSRHHGVLRTWKRRTDKGVTP